MKENGGWMSRKDIAMISGLTASNIGSAANKLLKFKEIELRESHRKFNKRVNHTNKLKEVRVSVHEYKIK